VGVTWDVFGDGRTSFRAGYGIGYERNFGNATFNLIQNPPNYAVLGAPGPITTNNFGVLGGSSGTYPLPRVGARVVDPVIKTARAHMWNVSIQHHVARHGIWSIEYSGSKGVDFYSIAYPNQAGFGNFVLGVPCTGLQPDGSTDCTAYPNTQYAANVGYRGNQGFSTYHSLNNRLQLPNFLGSGADLIVNYT
jgi:hypothetical protein